jgi:hypothetical protein
LVRQGLRSHQNAFITFEAKGNILEVLDWWTSRSDEIVSNICPVSRVRVLSSPAGSQTLLVVFGLGNLVSRTN